MHTILHIEDNILNQHLLRRYFKATDVNLIEAETGKQGIHLAQSYQPALILLDYHLPDMNGKVVAKEIRQLAALRDIPIIGLTADETLILHKQMRTEGFDLVLTKPISVTNLLHVISGYVQINKLSIA